MSEPTNHQNIIRAGRRGGTYHMPGIQVHERGQKVEPIGRTQGEDNQPGIRREKLLQPLRRTGCTRKLIPCRFLREGGITEVESEDQDIELNDTKNDKRQDIGVLRSLGFVAECENKLE